MVTSFNEEKWRALITTKPDWYVDIAPDLKSLWGRRDTLSKDEFKKIKIEVYSFFEKYLEEGAILLGESGEDWDGEREPIDTIVIHHTNNKPHLSLLRLNAIHFVNLYVAHYAKPRYQNEEHITGTPIWSGHFSNGKQIFYAYHWLVRMDGTAERLLKDSEIGWQAGNWDVNKRSVAICLDNDYSEGVPSESVLKAVSQIIRQNYKIVSKEKILGHREVNSATECPGSQFLTKWKHTLLGML